MKHVSMMSLACATALTAPRAIIGHTIKADNSDPKAMIAAVQSAVTELRASIDEKMKSKVDDAVLNERIARIDASVGNFQTAIDGLNAQIAASGINQNIIGDLPADPEYVKDFKAHMRKGDVQASMSKGSDADGGYLAPVEWDRTITNKLKEASPIRAHARTISITSAGFKKLFNDRAIGSGWVGETAPRPETGTPKIGVLEFPLGEIFANPAIAQGLLDDAAIDLEAWLASEVQAEFARQEGIAFLSGNGTNKPHGILTYVEGAANAARHPFGAIKTVLSGADAGFTADGLIDLIYDLPAEFRANAKLFTSRQSQSAMRKLKDGQGNFLWQASFALGQPATLAGEPVVELADMPKPEADAISVLYGDMDATYLIVDRIGIRVLRDPFTNKPFVHFYTTKRVGGGVHNPEPMRALKIGKQAP